MGCVVNLFHLSLIKSPSNLSRHFTFHRKHMNMIEKIFAQKCKNLHEIEQIHAQFLKLHLFHNPNAVASLISFASTSARPDFFSYTASILSNFRRYRTTFVYNNLIRGYVQCNLPKSSIICYKEMLQDGLIRNNYTFTPLVKACSMVSHRYSGFSVQAHVVKLGFSRDLFITSALVEFCALGFDMEKARQLFDEMTVRDVVLCTTMIDGYGKLGNVGKAREMFDEMRERNVISWSAIMAAYLRVSDFREVLSLFKRMEDAGLRPNESVLVSALTASGHLGDLGQGSRIHSYAKRCNYVSNTLLAFALVDMYSRCSCLQLALKIFDEIQDKDSGAWNAIISGLAMNGDALKSLELFDDMVLSGTRPTEATFVSILAACTHANLVDRGISLFESMTKVYNVEPTREHLACVIDLLARSGRIEEAERFMDEKISELGEGDAHIWGSLLGACRKYGKVDVGNRVWIKLANMGVTDYGAHMLAYNMYKEAGWDNEAQSVRRLISERQMKKKPGTSAVEVNGIVEEHIAGNNSNNLSHP